MSKRLVSYKLCFIFLIALLGLHVQLQAAEAELRVLHFGLSAASMRDLKKHDAEIGLSGAISETFKNTHYKIEMQVYRSKEALFKDLDNNQLDGFWGTGLEVLERRDMLMVPMITNIKTGAGTQQSFLLVANKQHHAESILQLKNKKLVLPVFSDIETLYLSTQLLKNKQPDTDKFFTYMPEVKNANVAIMDVYFGRADVTMVKQQDYNTAISLNPQLINKIEVIEQTPAYLITAGGVIKTRDKAEILRLLDIVMKSAKEPETKGFLTLMNADGLAYVNDDDFDSIASLAEEYHQLKKQCINKGRKNRIKDSPKKIGEQVE